MLVNYVKRSMRGRHLFFILASFLLFYVTLNYLLFYWVDPQSGQNGADDDAIQQIVSLIASSSRPKLTWHSQ